MSKLKKHRAAVIKATGVPLKMMLAAEDASTQAIQRGASQEDAWCLAMDTLAELLESRNAADPGGLAEKGDYRG